MRSKLPRFEKEENVCDIVRNQESDAVSSDFVFNFLYIVNHVIQMYIAFIVLHSTVFVKAHLRECKYVIVDCPNLCGRRTTRKKMDDHLRKECAKRRVTCSRCRREMSRDQVQVILFKNLFSV